MLSKLAAKRLQASFKNFDLELEGSFTLKAKVEESRIATETPEIPWGEDLEEKLDLLDGSTKYFASVRPIYINIPVYNSDISASSITIDADTQILMNTLSRSIPAAVNVAVLSSKISIGGNSSFSANSGDLKLVAKNTVKSTVKAEATDSAAYAIAMAIVDQMTQVVVTDSVRLYASGNIKVNANSDIDSAVAAYGSAESQDKSGVYSTVTVVDQNTLAKVSGSATAKAGGDIDVSAKENTNAKTDATSGAAPEEPKEVKLTRPFIYMLINTKTNTPFFIGTVDELK